ncbi:hypothetical protein HK102_002904 [Quaeritorhiza haematococci]|nr:hypothetical protein HK102_002904 [Quaeritorhiza haematococci]
MKSLLLAGLLAIGARVAAVAVPAPSEDAAPEIMTSDAVGEIEWIDIDEEERSNLTTRQYDTTLSISALDTLHRPALRTAQVPLWMLESVGITTAKLDALNSRPVHLDVCLSSSILTAGIGLCSTRPYDLDAVAGCAPRTYQCSCGSAFDVAFYRDAAHNCVPAYDPARKCPTGCSLMKRSLHARETYDPSLSVSTADWLYKTPTQSHSVPSSYLGQIGLSITDVDRIATAPIRGYLCLSGLSVYAPPVTSTCSSGWRRIDFRAGCPIQRFQCAFSNGSPCGSSFDVQLIRNVNYQCVKPYDPFRKCSCGAGSYVRQL